MPDSSQNGHSSAPRPIVRPPVGERSSRYLASDTQELEAIDAIKPEEVSNGTEPEELARPYTFDEADIEASGNTITADAQPPLLDARLDEEEEDEEVLAQWNNSGGEPPDTTDGDDSSSGSWNDPNTPRDKEQGLVEHLTELRQRILNCVIVVCLAMVLTWYKGVEISSWFSKPIRDALGAKPVNGNKVIEVHNRLISTDPTAFFTIYLQISMISAIILTMPFILLQVWRFIEPALTNNERKYTLVLVPFSSLLFFMGAGMGYILSPLFFKFFLEYQPIEVEANWDYLQSIVLLAKTLLVFGLAFQVPVIIIFLNKAGVLSRNVLIEYWRHAVVVIFTIIAIVTPTWDPITMTACAIPPCLLYVLSIWLVKWL